MTRNIVRLRQAPGRCRHGAIAALFCLRLLCGWFVPGLSSSANIVVVMSSALLLPKWPALTVTIVSTLLPSVLDAMFRSLLPGAEGMALLALRLALALTVVHITTSIVLKAEILDAIAQHIRDRLIVVDQKGIVAYISPAAVQSPSRLTHDIEGRSVFQYLPEWLLPIARELIAAAGAGDSSARTPIFMVNREGPQVPVVVKAQPLKYLDANYVLATVENVAGPELTQRIFSFGLDAVNMPMVLRTPDARIIWCNQRYADEAGSTKEQLVGAQSSPFTVPGYDPVAGISRLRHLASNDWEKQMPDGRIMECHAYPILNEDGTMLAAISISRDVTEQRAAEARARQAERLAAVGQLSAGIAHNFNNVLAAISASAELIRLRGGALESTAADNILKAVEHGSSMVNKLYELAGRQQAPNLEPVAVADAFGCVLQVMEAHIAQAGLVVEKAVPADLCVEADPEQLRQVLMNLILNSLQAMPLGGRLSLRVEPAGDALDLHVTDTGCGIPPEHMDLLFQPFFTTKGALNGTGLGLPTSRTMVRAMGGDMRVSSTPGEGTTVSVRLPRAKTTASVA